MSAINIPKKLPIQPSFRHLTNLLQIHGSNFDKIKEYFREEIKDEDDLKRLKARAERASNWINKHASDDFRFVVQKTVPKGLKLEEKQKQALHLVAKILKEREFDEVGLHEEFYRICKELDLDIKEFFKVAYLVLLAKEKGPKLANFILTVGKDKVVRMFEKV